MIVDEAHSSQGSKHSGNLTKVLGAVPHKSGMPTEEEILAASEIEGNAGVEPPDFEDVIVDAAKSRGRQPNISFYAFFDQPLLHTMFIDKKLKDLKAVQTLSRLNRTVYGKTDTFVLDFSNKVDEIQEAFKPYFEQTCIDEPTDPNLLYTLNSRLRAAPVLRVEDSEGEEFKSTLQSFTRLYDFLSQVIDWQDAELEKLYAYGRHLLTKLPYRNSGDHVQLDHEIELIAYRNEKTFEGNAALRIAEDDHPVYGPSEVGTGQTRQDVMTALSAILDVINKRLGTNWTDKDKLLFDQIVGDMVDNQELAEKARANSKTQFEQVFEQEAITAFISRQGRNEKIIEDFMSNPEMRALIIAAMLDEVYSKARAEEIKHG